MDVLNLNSIIKYPCKYKYEKRSERRRFVSLGYLILYLYRYCQYGSPLSRIIIICLLSYLYIKIRARKFVHLHVFLWTIRFIAKWARNAFQDTTKNISKVYNAYFCIFSGFLNLQFFRVYFIIYEDTAREFVYKKMYTFILRELTRYYFLKFFDPTNTILLNKKTKNIRIHLKKIKIF